MTAAALLFVLQSVVTLPAAVRSDLDSWCAGWRLAPVIPEVSEEIRTRTPQWPPNLILGDFDRNGETDVAVLAECPKDANARVVQVLAYLAGKGGFTRFELSKPDRPDEREFLHLVIGASATGERRHSIGVEFYTLGGHSWTYVDRQWLLVKDP